MLPEGPQKDTLSQIRTVQHAASCQHTLHPDMRFQAPVRVHLHCFGHLQPWDVGGLGSATVSR